MTDHEEEFELHLADLERAATPQRSLRAWWESFCVLQKIDRGVRPNIAAACRLLRQQPITRDKAQKAAVLLRKSGQTMVAIELLKKLGFLDDAADILATTSKLPEAAALYVKAENWREAVRCYVILQDFHRAARCAVKAGDFDTAARLFNKSGERQLAARCMVKGGGFEQAILELFTQGSLDLVADAYRSWAAADSTLHLKPLFTGEWEILTKLLLSSASSRETALKRCAHEQLLTQVASYFVEQGYLELAAQLLQQHRSVILPHLVEGAMNDEAWREAVAHILQQGGEEKLALQLQHPTTAGASEQPARAATPSEPHARSVANEPWNDEPSMETWPPELTKDGEKVICSLDGFSPNRPTEPPSSSTHAANLIHRHLQGLWQHGHTRTYQPGAVLVRLGDVPPGIFYVLEGRLAIYRKVDGRLALVDTVESGKSLGESWAIMGRNSQIQVAALSSCRIHLIEREKLAPLIQLQPDATASELPPGFVAELMQHIASRIDLPESLHHRLAVGGSLPLARVG